MRHVVGTVEVYAVPAGGEAEGYQDSFFAFAGREVDDFWLAGHPCVHACVGELAELGSLF